MANQYTLHKTVSNIRMLADAVLPEFNEELLVAVARGRVTTWAVYVEHDMSNCEWSIGKVEPWDAYKHINAERHGAVKVYGRDELDAYKKKRRVQPQGQHHVNAKLTNKQAEQIRRRYATGEYQVPLAKEYGVSQQVVSLIIRGKAYR